VEICIKCGEPLTEENWSRGLRRARDRTCIRCHSIRTSAYYHAHRDERMKWSREYHRLVKLEALTRYSASPPRCVCCGESEVAFLTIDHIKDDGAEQRKTISDTYRGRDYYFWLKRNNYPMDLSLQVLCWNCQWGKRSRGICPHKGGESSATFN
jgi:hypothetical protein